VLRPEHVVGRSPRSDLFIEAEYVSVLHATIRWNGEGWEIKDLGSLNGTHVDEQPLALGQTASLKKGSTIWFGNQSESWSMIEDTPPRVMAISLESEEIALPDGDMLAIPSAHSPELVLLRGAQGGWEREEADGTLTPMRDQDRFVTRAGRWVFCCPQVIAPTSALADRATLRSAGLEFEVSLDEEHVEVTLRTGGKRIRLGARAHNYLMLTMARRRIADQAAGFIPSGCGWIYVEELLEELKVTAEQLNLEIFRIRQQFGALGFHQPIAIVERRPRTRQLRLGIAELSVRTI
jgi:hypothetical protein